MAALPFRLSRGWIWVLAVIGGVILLVVVLSYVIESESLRDRMEARINGKLEGYTVHVGKVHFHPLSFSLDLKDLSLVQNAAPDPPIADIGKLHASVHWRELLRARLVGDFLIDSPKLYINLKNVRKEEESKVPLKKKGWQEALQSIYPLKINVFRIRDGEVTYVDQGPFKPLHVSGIHGYASDIRNVRSAEGEYPSPVHLEAKVFEKGRVSLDGHADFLAEPHIGFKGEFEISDLDLSYVKPISERYNLSLRKGMVSAKGNVEYAPKTTTVHFKKLEIKDAEADYVHLASTAAEEKERKEKAREAAKEKSNKPGEKIRIDLLKIENGAIGYRNRAVRPAYRLYFDHLQATLENFSNKFAEGPAKLNLTGKFMGTGETKVTGTFRAETKSPDFSMNIAIENTEMPAMTNLFRAYGNFDIKAGLFSLYSELTVKENRVDGYVKPLFKDMEVYDKRNRREKNLFHKFYVGLVGGVTKLLENKPREEVATKADVSGSLEKPNTDTWQVLLNLLQNAFIRAILPGFEQEVGRPRK